MRARRKVDRSSKPADPARLRGSEMVTGSYFPIASQTVASSCDDSALFFGRPESQHYRFSGFLIILDRFSPRTLPNLVLPPDFHAARPLPRGASSVLPKRWIRSDTSNGSVADRQHIGVEVDMFRSPLKVQGGRSHLHAVLCHNLW